MARYFRAFVNLSLLTPLVMLPSLDSVQGLSIQIVDQDSPEYESCLAHDAGCATYLNITSVCSVLANDCNYTVDAAVYHSNYLNCICPDSQYLPGLELCDKCTGGSDYPLALAECNAYMGETPLTMAPLSTMTVASQTPLMKLNSTMVTASQTYSAEPTVEPLLSNLSSTASGEVSTYPPTQANPSHPPLITSTSSPANSLSLSLMGNLPTILAASVLGVAATLAGVI